MDADLVIYRALLIVYENEERRYGNASLFFVLYSTFAE